MKTMMILLSLITCVNVMAGINRCELHNKLICKNVTQEWGARPNLAMIFFVKGIIEKESAWEENSERTEPNGKTSYGLMHIQGPTAAEIGHDGPEHDLLKTEIGLKYGIRYLVKKLKIAIEEAKKGKHSVWEIAAASYNRGSIGYRANGTLISNRDPIGNGKYLTYEEAVINLASRFLGECRHMSIEQICQ